MVRLHVLVRFLIEDAWRDRQRVVRCIAERGTHHRVVDEVSILVDGGGIVDVCKNISPYRFEIINPARVESPCSDNTKCQRVFRQRDVDHGPPVPALIAIRYAGGTHIHHSFELAGVGLIRDDSYGPTQCRRSEQYSLWPPQHFHPRHIKELGIRL